MNFNNLAELNPALNYNNYGKLQPMNFKNNDYDEIDEPTYFNSSKQQDFIKFQDGLSNVGKNESYYCGGNATIASKHLHMENSQLAKIYFSQENIDRINKQVRREIYRRTDGKFRIEKDSDNLDMQTVMDIVFDEHAKHLPDQIIRQVKLLNNQTVDYIVPNAITMIDQTSKYLKQLDQPIQPMDRPLNVNNGGRKTLPSMTSRLGF